MIAPVTANADTTDTAAALKPVPFPGLAPHRDMQWIPQRDTEPTMNDSKGWMNSRTWGQLPMCAGEMCRGAPGQGPAGTGHRVARHQSAYGQVQSSLDQTVRLPLVNLTLRGRSLFLGLAQLSCLVFEPSTSNVVGDPPNSERPPLP